MPLCGDIPLESPEHIGWGNTVSDEPNGVRNTTEASLRRLRADLLRLHGRMYTEDTRKSEAQLVNSLRLIEQALLLPELFLVAVAGPQGVGKTTLVREIYGIDRKVLGGNLGQGEKMPVVVREVSSLADGEFRLWIRTLAAEGEPFPDAESLDVWKQAVRAEHDKALVVGIDVPARLFGDGFGFLLLPGFEEESARNQVWQRQMRNGLLTSAAVVIVTDEHTMASRQAATAASELKSLTDKVVRPIIAITRTEAADEDKRAELRAKAVQVFAPTARDHDVVLTGTGTSEFRQEWTGALRDRLEEARRNKGELRREQLTLLRRSLRGHLTPVLREAQEIVDGYAIGNPDEQTYQKWAEQFRDQVALARTDYEAAIKAALESQHTRADATLTEHLDKTDGWRGNRDAVLAFIQAKSAQHKIDRSHQVLGNWNGSVNYEDLRKAALAAQTKVVNRAVANPVEADVSAPATALTSGGNESSTTPDEGAGLPVPTVALHDLQFIAGRRVEPSTMLGEAVRLLPAVGLENLALVREQALLRAYEKGGAKAVESEDLSKTFAGLNKNRKILLGGLAAFIGVDVGVDGDLDSVPALGNAIRTTLFGASPTAAAATAATAIAAAVIAAAAGFAVIAAADSAATKRVDQAHAILREAQQHAFNSHMEEFDATMRFLGDRLEARLRSHLKIDEHSGRLLRLQAALADARTSYHDLLEVMETDRDGMA